MQASNQIFTLLVEGAPYGTEASSLAYLFVQETLKKHNINGIFFYQNGVFNANHLTNPAADEFDLVNSWSKLACKHGFKLIICSAAGERRGVIETNLASGYQIGSLSDLATLSLQSDKVVQFK